MNETREVRGYAMSDDRRPVALVTGGSRGIGRGICVALAREGFSVAVNYANNRDAAEEACAECRDAAKEVGSGASGAARGSPEAPAGEPRFVPVQANIGTREERERMLSEVFDTFGRLDALVNNAGMPPRSRDDILEATEENFDEVMSVNLHGPYFITQQVARRWVSGEFEPLLPHGFKIVFVGSISADTVSLNRGEYCVSKAGVAMASQLWAVRLADENIQVYEVRPGITATDMTSGVREKYDRLIGEGLVPQRRWGTPEDNGKAVASLIRGDFPFSTGEVINVDGGFHISRL
jgi:NAD(P)-dependent dehydrogenase (short-subunit alcohol dehydrogenase family)